MQSLIRSKSAGVTGGRGTAGAGPGRDLLYGSRGVGGRRGPKGKGKGATGPQGRAGQGMGAWGGGQVEGRGAGSTAPPQPDVQPVRCFPPGIQQMPVRHTNHHHPHHARLYNIDPDAEELMPPQHPRPKHQPAPPPHRERSRRG